MKICLVGSRGGHLKHLYLMKTFWEKHERFWVTFDKTDSRSLLEDEKAYWCYFPTNRNIKNLIRNTFLAMKILHKERPDLILSTGAAPAIPYFWLARIYKAKTVFIEVYDRIEIPTITGKLVQPVADCFLLQWEEQKEFYRKGIYIGGIM